MKKKIIPIGQFDHLGQIDQDQNTHDPHFFPPIKNTKMIIVIFDF